MHTDQAPALSILIATAGRLDSLRDVLARLAACSGSASYEVVVIDNAVVPPLTPAVLRTEGLQALRILREERRGKSYALNRVLDEGGLGEVIAVLDDDMSPATDWVEGVLSASRRLPQFDIFSGRSHVVWPAGVAEPAWAGHPLAEGLLFSVYDLGPAGDFEFGNGGARFPSGNHFWFRRSVLEGGARFPHVWTTEAHFVVALRSIGHRGMFVPEAVAGHRIQPDLVNPGKFRERAYRMGREMARLDASLAAHTGGGMPGRIRSMLRPLRALIEIGAWSAAWLVAGIRPAKARLPAQARALWGIGYGLARLSPSLGKERIAGASNSGGGNSRAADAGPGI